MTAEAATVFPEDLRELKKWLATHPGSMPKAGELLLEHVFGLIDSLHQSRHRLSRSLNTIRRLLGVVPKSEQRKLALSGHTFKAVAWWVRCGRLPPTWPPVSVGPIPVDSSVTGGRRVVCSV